MKTREEELIERIKRAKEERDVYHTCCMILDGAINEFEAQLKRLNEDKSEDSSNV